MPFEGTVLYAYHFYSVSADISWYVSCMALCFYSFHSHLKSMGIHHVAAFPFPTPPERVGLCTALRTLTLLGALEPLADSLSGTSGLSVSSAVEFVGLNEPSGRITSLGRTLSVFPVAPRYRYIYESQQSW